MLPVVCFPRINALIVVIPSYLWHMAILTHQGSDKYTTGIVINFHIEPISYILVGVLVRWQNEKYCILQDTACIFRDTFWNIHKVIAEIFLCRMFHVLDIMNSWNRLLILQFVILLSGELRFLSSLVLYDSKTEYWLHRKLPWQYNYTPFDIHSKN